MSWDGYLTNLVAHSKDAAGIKHVDKCCIIGLDGSKWTTDGSELSLKLTGPECSDIAKTFKSTDFTAFQASGIKAEGIKYQFLRRDEQFVAAKKKDHGALSLQASKTAIVIGHTKEGCQQGNANKAVAVIAEYLEEQNM